MVAALIIPNLGVESIAHTISQTIEETCEMLGVVIFIYVLLDYIRREIGPLRIRCLEEPRLLVPTRVPDINDVSASGEDCHASCQPIQWLTLKETNLLLSVKELDQVKLAWVDWV